MRANPRAVLAVPMLLESSEQTAPPSAPNKNKRSVEKRSPEKAETASGAVQASSPNIAGGKQPRKLTYAAVTSGDGLGGVQRDRLTL